ncbi:MAG: OmpA family protein [bacterium]|nr:OmpA family protein [bacterium]
MWKCKPYGLLWGLPLLALLWLLVFFGERRNIEADLADRVTTRLEDAGLNWAKVEFSGLHGVISGMAGGVKEQDDAVALAEKTWGVWDISENMDVVRTASPYRWSADIGGSKLVLEGYVPSLKARKAINTMAMAQFPGVKIIDKMELAWGEPNRRTFMETVGFGLKQLTGFTYGRVELSDRNFSIEGLTKDAASFKSLKEALRENLPLDTRLISNRTKAPEVLVPLASPFSWTANKQDKVLRLSGHVHSASQKRDIIFSARRAMPDHRVIDNMEIARGTPTKRQWNRATSFALVQLAKLQRGIVTLEDLDYMITGHAANRGDFSDVEKGLSKLPNGFRVAKKRLTAPVEVKPEIKPIVPYVWRADFHARRLTLSGNIPDKSTKRIINSQAKRYFPRADIIDKMEIGPGVPKSWSEAINSSLSQLARLDNGNAMVWNTEIRLSGKAASVERREDILERMKSGIPPIYQFFDQIRIKEPEFKQPEVFIEQPEVRQYQEEEFLSEDRLERSECQSYLDSILSGGNIQFSPASAEFRKDSFPVLTRLAHTANRCPGTRIEIVGHTDSDGSRKFNEFLSLRRARSVVNYLTSKGVSKDRLSSVGYGEARPILPNTSDSNKARNRRIEFKVKEF